MTETADGRLQTAERRWLSAVCRLLSAVFLLAFAAAAYARVGGGESYGGGSSGGGGGGGGGGGELIYLVFRLLLWLTIEHPLIGIPIDILVIVAIVKYRNSRGETKTNVTITATAVPRAARIDELRRFDPNFSQTVFMDFVYSLYAKAHLARASAQLDQYAPYLSDTARARLRAMNPQGLQEVRGVVIGACNVASLRGIDTPQVTLAVNFETNYTEVVAGTQSSWYAREQWLLERKRDILSPPPAKAKADHCPRCGAALKTRTDGACDYCGVKIESGTFQWYVRTVNVIAREPRGPLLTSNVPEHGTDRPTIWQRQIGVLRTEFEQSHPGFSWPAFQARVTEIANTLQASWNALDWEPVRPLETEPLFQMHRYWIDAYRKQKLRNVVDEFSVTAVDIVKIDTDAFYESVTVRLRARGYDHTDDANGKVIAGSKTGLRVWSEYWTLIRTRDAATATKTTSCPNCGAALQAGATGVCPYCGGKLTAGSYDWVLSRIEQDEAYAG